MDGRRHAERGRDGDRAKWQVGSSGLKGAADWEVVAPRGAGELLSVARTLTVPCAFTRPTPELGLRLPLGTSYQDSVRVAALAVKLEWRRFVRQYVR